MAEAIVIRKQGIEPSDNQFYFLIAGDPTSLGLTAGIGSLAQRIDGAGGDTYRKTGAAATNWVLLAPDFGAIAVTNLSLSGLLTESATNAVTAFAGGGQTSATALTTELNRVTTVASAGDSVKLPAATAGLTIVVVNSGANSMQVFGAGTDTINGVPTATGVPQMVNSAVIYSCVVAGSWQAEGLGTGFSNGLQTLAVSNGLTAHAGGTQGAALALTASVNRVATVATAADSVSLPASAAGLVVTVINDAALAMQVFGAGTDTINGVATATGVSQIGKSVVVYSCAVAGSWHAEGLGSGFSAGLQTLAASNALTAHAGGTQGAALALTSTVNRIATVASAADSVSLPASAPGMVVTIINDAALSCQVFGAGTDTINGVATATGVAQMGKSVVVYSCPAAGVWQAEGLGQGFSGSLPTQSQTNAITAFATGGQTSAVALSTGLNRITVCATIGDSVKLPISAAGMVIAVTVNGAAAAAADIFPGVGDVIDTLAANTAIRVSPGSTVAFYCAVAGTWSSTPTPLPYAKFVTINVTAGTLAVGNATGAAFVGLTSTNATPGNQTTRTATQMFADTPNARVGDCYVWRITQTGAGTLTLLAGGGVTLTGTATVATNTWRDFTVTFTSAIALVIQNIATGTFS